VPPWRWGVLQGSALGSLQTLSRACGFSTYFESAGARMADGRLRRSIDAALHASAVAEELLTTVCSTDVDGSECSWGSTQLIRDTDNTPSGNGAAVSTLLRARVVRSLSQALSDLREARAALNGGSTILARRGL
jgi:hypothetical protein